jgi:hypothetical protein
MSSALFYRYQWRNEMQRQQNTPWGGYAILLVLVIAIIFVFATLYRQQFNALMRGLEPSCNIAIGTSTITVQAWGANDDCEQMLAGTNNFTYRDWSKLGGTLVSEPASGSILCELDMSERHITVRDSAPYSNNGQITCGILNGSVPNGVLPQ